MSDHDIGNSEYYNPNAYRDSSYPQRPQGGFVEERLTKVEFHQSEIISVLGDSTKGVIACRACGQAVMPPIHGHMHLPICHDCFETIGRITLAKKSWLLK